MLLSFCFTVPPRGVADGTIPPSMAFVRVPAGRNLQAAWRIHGDFVESAGKPPETARRQLGARIRVIYAPCHALPVRTIRAGHGTLRTSCRRRAMQGRATGLFADCAAGREPRAPGFPRRDHREDLGRAHRLGRRHLEPHQVGAAGARRRRQGTALHQDHSSPGPAIRGAGPGRACRFGCKDRVGRIGRGRSTRTDRCRDHTPFDRRAPVSPGRRCRALCRHCGRPAPRTDRRAVATALALRHRARIIVPPARPGRRHGRDRPSAGRALCAVGNGRDRGREPRRDGRARRHPDSSVVWAERYSGAVDDVHAVRADIRSRILATLEVRIRCTRRRWHG